MKIAKPTPADLDAACNALQILNNIASGYHPGQEEGGPYFDPDNPEHLRQFYDLTKATLDAAPGWHNRVIGGMAYGIMFEKNEIIDPDADTLELHPRFAQVQSQLQALLQEFAAFKESSAAEIAKESGIKKAAAKRIPRLEANLEALQDVQKQLRGHINHLVDTLFQLGQAVMDPAFDLRTVAASARSAAALVRGEGSERPQRNESATDGENDHPVAPVLMKKMMVRERLDFTGPPESKVLFDGAPIGSMIGGKPYTAEDGTIKRGGHSCRVYQGDLMLEAKGSNQEAVLFKIAGLIAKAINDGSWVATRTPKKRSLQKSP